MACSLCENAGERERETWNCGKLRSRDRELVDASYLSLFSFQAIFLHLDFFYIFQTTICLVRKHIYANGVEQKKFIAFFVLCCYFPGFNLYTLHHLVVMGIMRKTPKREEEEMNSTLITPIASDFFPSRFNHAQPSICLSLFLCNHY